MTKQRSETETAVSARKKRIFADMAAYRKKHGIGCFRQISEAMGGRVAVHTLAHMYMGTKVHNETWLQVGQALEKLRMR